MHICFLCDEYPPVSHGGLGTKIRLLARGLVARGHRVTVVGMGPPSIAGLEEDQGVSIIRLSMPQIPFTGYLARRVLLSRALRRLHREQPVDVLEGSELSFAAVDSRFPAPKVIRIAGGHHFFAVTLGKQPRLWPSWLERRSFSKADAFCSGSRFAAETTRALLELGNRPIEILPNPVDTDVFRPRPDLPADPGLLVFAGTVSEKKGVRQLLQAMPLIVAAVPSAHLQILGRDTRDPATGGSYVASLKADLPTTLARHITFSGPVPNSALPEMLARAHACVFPSHMETVGNVNLEAMAVGRPLITSVTGPGRELVEHGVHGMLCDPFNPQSIADCVIAVLKDAQLARKLGDNARARAEAEFSIPAILARNECFFQRRIGLPLDRPD